MPMMHCIYMYFCLMNDEKNVKHADRSSLDRSFAMNLTEIRLSTRQIF